MQIGYIGLGKMGHNMTLRLRDKGHSVVAFDSSEESRTRAREEGTTVVDSLSALAESIAPPRTLWVMVPHAVVDNVLNDLLTLIDKDDVIIDGGNTFFKETLRRAENLAKKGIHYLDVGVSGGPRGARDGACMMIGGKEEEFQKYEPLFRDLCVPQGFGYMGTHGAGHFVKMIHNGIEYGMMQAIAEGYSILKKQKTFELNLARITEVYNHGSVIESRLVGWLQEGFKEYGEELAEISGSVSHTGEGAWTVDSAHEIDVPARIIEGSLEFRKESEKNPSYAGKILSTLRNQFGGHKT
jgi:6-phosphogluconate dehydrogenase